MGGWGKTRSSASPRLAALTHFVFPTHPPVAKGGVLPPAKMRPAGLQSAPLAARKRPGGRVWLAPSSRLAPLVLSRLLLCRQNRLHLVSFCLGGRPVGFTGCLRAATGELLAFWRDAAVPVGGRILADVGRFRPTLGNTRPTSRVLPSAGQSRPISDQHGPTWVAFCEALIDFGQHRPRFGPSRRVLAECGPKLGSRSRCSAIVGQVFGGILDSCGTRRDRPG